MTSVLLITVDDLNYNSLGITGQKLPDLSPNIDQLAAEGLFFEHSHVVISVCQPSRSALMTGRYPHRNGARGFEEIAQSVTTLTEVLSKEGYYNGIIGKEDHLAPREKFAWDEYITTYHDQDDFGRNPAKYYEYTRSFLRNAKKQNQPFFLMANSHDPHRPFANSDDELKFFGRHVRVDHEYSPEEVEVPGFLPDIPEVRKEIAQYYSSVRRCDQTVGQILQALDDGGLREDTLVLFLSDNGMAFPFAKTNCYLNSTKSPWIMRWPQVIEPGRRTGALVSGIDFMPTVLDALGLEPVTGMDGRSFMHLLRGDSDEHYETIYTQFFKTACNPMTKRERHYPMRCVQDKRFAYIFNPWSDQETAFVNESMSGLTFRAMKEAAEDNEEIASRVQFYEHRVVEELYDYVNDPDALHNLIAEPAYQKHVLKLRLQMHEYLESTQDELLPAFLNQKKN